MSTSIVTAPLSPATLPLHGPGYLAKFGPVDESRVFWVDPITGTRVSGNEQKARHGWIAALMAIDAKYPVVEGAVTLEEHKAQMAANDKTLRQARRDVAAKIVAAIK